VRVRVDHLRLERLEPGLGSTRVCPPVTQIGTIRSVADPGSRNDADLVSAIGEGPLHARDKRRDPPDHGGRVGGQDSDPCHPEASCKTASIWGPMASQSYFRVACRRSGARLARSLRSSGRYSATRLANNSGLAGHTRPIEGSDRTRETSPTSVENTGVPHARLSSMTVGNCSMSDVTSRPSAAEYK